MSTDAEVLDLLGRLPVPKRQPNLLFAAVAYVAGVPGGLHRVPRNCARPLARDQRADVGPFDPDQRGRALRDVAAVPGPAAPAAGVAGGRGQRGTVPAARPVPLRLHRPERHRFDPRPARRHGDPAVPGARGSTFPTAVPTVAWRAGLDLHPVDADDPEQVAWLDALVWPGADDRAGSAARRSRRGPVRPAPGRGRRPAARSARPGRASAARRDAGRLPLRGAGLPRPGATGPPSRGPSAAWTRPGSRTRARPSPPISASPTRVSAPARS